MAFPSKKAKVKCAMTLMTENMTIDSSKLRPPMKTAPDNFGSCHINISPTATFN